MTIVELGPPMIDPSKRALIQSKPNKITETEAIDNIVKEIPTIESKILLGNCFITSYNFISKPASNKIINKAKDAKSGAIVIKIVLSIKLKVGPIKNPNNNNQITSGICVLLKMIEHT
jgi:hypothetical protein